MSGTYYVYILTNKRHSILYVGMTNNLLRRVYEHRQKLIPGFTHKYNTTELVYYELFPTAWEAIKWEKQIKKWRRSKKESLFNKMNPDWDDLYETLDHE